VTHVVVIGAGMGGMAAALRARRHGAEVTLIEARAELGGLASAVRAGGQVFDGGPYILLDRIRLEWALDRIGVDLGELEMLELDPAYRVTSPHHQTLSIFTDIDETVASINSVEPGVGDTYRAFVGRARTALDQLAPMLVRPHGATSALRTGAWRAGTWAAGSLNQVLRANRLEGVAADAVRIWTYIAGGDPRRAPGPLALVPALIHRDGAARPAGGIHQVVALVESALHEAGVTILRSCPVARIDHDKESPHRVRGVTTAAGDAIAADLVISDIGGAAALLDLVDAPPPAAVRARMAGPLQSPGVTAYLSVQGAPDSEITFRVDGHPKQASAFIAPKQGLAPDQLVPARIVAPLSHDRANELGEGGQRALLDEMVGADWWRGGIDSIEISATRLVPDWGREFSLRDDAMNQIMARRQLLLGRLPHRINHLPGLFLAGSWTHPGQWISFCSVSGVLAADAALGIETHP